MRSLTSVLLSRAVWAVSVTTLVSAAAVAAPFGRVVVVGGHASDLALDETRRLVYVANFTGNRIDVISTEDLSIRNRIRVAAQPGSLAVSPDGRYLVTTHFANFENGGAPTSGFTIIDLQDNSRRNIALTEGHALTVDFGNSPRAFVVTTKAFLLLDPATAAQEILLPTTLNGEQLPIRWSTYPPDILRAASTVAADGNSVHVLAQLGLSSGGGAGSASVVLRYDIPTGLLTSLGLIASPPLGPRVISTDEGGIWRLAGWGLLDGNNVLRAQFPRGDGEYEVGSHAIDSTRGLIYAHIPAAGTATPLEPPVLHVMDLDNMTVRERLQLPENLAGPALLSRDRTILYAVSDSGITILPVGALDRTPRLAVSEEALLFQSNACENRAVIREFEISDPSGANTDFQVSVPSTARGIRVVSNSGRTPATVRIEVDPTAFRPAAGTSVVSLDVTSTGAVNLVPSISLLINTPQPEQKGAIISVPGTIVDMLADPVRSRLYLLRQDRNQVIVYDTTTFERVSVLRTGNTPVHMAITTDNKYLLVGNDNSQYANVYDLETLVPSAPIVFPFGLYPRTIAAANGAIWATARSASGPHRLARLDMSSRTAATPESLGIYRNEIQLDSALASSPSGKTVFLVMSDGQVVLYDPEFDAFASSRQNSSSLSDGYAVFNDDLLVVGRTLLNRSLVPVGTLPGGGTASGYAFVEGLGLRVTNTGANGPGTIDRIDVAKRTSIGATPTVEAPLTRTMLAGAPIGQVGRTVLPFTRSLAPLLSAGSIAVRTVSGFVVLPWRFESPSPAPSISDVRNIADSSTAVASGGLVSITGANLAEETGFSSRAPWPASLANVCATVNNFPITFGMVSPGEIRGQLPREVAGASTLVVRTSGGVSAPFPLTVLPSAAAIFRQGVAGDSTGLPMIYRSANQELVTFTNPIRDWDVLTIFGTGIGATTPVVENGFAAPFSPLANSIATPIVRLGGVDLTVAFSGLVPDLVGVYQINAVVPPGVPEGRNVRLSIEMGSFNTSADVRVVRP